MAAGSSRHKRSLNGTNGIESWERSRSEKLDRRSRLHPSPTIFGNASFANEDPPPPGITPPPNLRDRVKRQEGGGGVTVTIVDRCPVCAEYDLDLSPAAYNVLGDPDAGRIEIEWRWLDD
jgi:hypothetical protein